MAVPEQGLLQQCIEAAHAHNPRPFMENFLVVSTKNNELVPFRFNRLQDYMHKKTTGRDFWVKYRQGGSSLYHLGRLLTYCVTIPYFNAAVVTLSTDKGRTAERLFRHVGRMVEGLPEGLRPSKGHERADGYIEFDYLESQMYIGTVGSREFGRSETLHALMVTEFGQFKPNEARSITTSAIESVVPGGIIVFETTPRSIGSYAHSFYLDCKHGRRPYRAGFVPWFWSEDYHLPRGSPEALAKDAGDIVLTPEERALAAKFFEDGVSIEDRVRWRRAKIADRGDDFYAEHPEDDVSCWLAVTSGVFPASELRQMLLECREPEEKTGGVRIHKRSSPLRSYVCAVDGASGIPDGDYAAAVVQCVETGEVMAVFQDHIGPDVLAREVAELGLRYGRMMVGGERDAWTLQVLQSLEKMGYDNLYSDEETPDKIGFPATNTSRVRGVAALRAAILQGDFRTYDEPLVQELMQYEKTSDDRSGLEKFGAPVGLHDDLCVCAQRAQQMRLSVPSGQAVYSANRPESVMSSYPSRRW
mgnify:CR=1 FL=1